MDATVLDKSKPRESASGSLPDRWNYQTFKDYLLALSRGPEFRAPLEQMPREIELSPDWHQLLDNMRNQTSNDMTERFMKIGFKADRNGLVLPNNGTLGLKGNVPAYAISYDEFKMKYTGKTEGTIGDIHSHPRKIDDRPLDTLLSASTSSFSLGDLYGMVYKGSNPGIMGVVDGRHNIFALKTRDTKETNAPSQDKFVEAWYRRNGWKLLKNENLNDGERAERVDPKAPSIQELTAKVAAEYGFTLYKGEQGKPLKRVYPEVPRLGLRHRIISKVNPFVTKR